MALLEEVESACRSGDLRALQRLLPLSGLEENKELANMCLPGRNYTPLMEASSAGYADLVAHLLAWVSFGEKCRQLVIGLGAGGW
jgi:hypothetical protein